MLNVDAMLYADAMLYDAMLRADDAGIASPHRDPSLSWPLAKMTTAVHCGGLCGVWTRSSSGKEDGDIPHAPPYERTRKMGRH